jgi:hypothetical protein
MSAFEEPDIWSNESCIGFDDVFATGESIYVRITCVERTRLCAHSSAA